MAQKACNVLGASHSPFHSPLGSPAQITDFLYLGNLTAARNEALLKQTGITYVINGRYFVTVLFNVMGEHCRAYACELQNAYLYLQTRVLL